MRPPRLFAPLLILISSAALNERLTRHTSLSIVPRLTCRERLAAQAAASSASPSDSLSILSSTPLPSSSSPQPPSDGSQTSLADPREEGEDKQRSIEEKIVGLMDAVRKDKQA